MMNVTTQLESDVRSYCRSFPTVFAKASGSTLTDVRGRRCIDFFSGAGTLNYGHNHPVLTERLLDYIASDGPFSSFEEAGIVPDTVTLSKSLSGYGLPFSLVLMKPELDIWKPGEHNGTFRGYNLALATARAALEKYRRDDELTRTVSEDDLAAGLNILTTCAMRVFAEMAVERRDVVGAAG